MGNNAFSVYVFMCVHVYAYIGQRSDQGFSPVTLHLIFLRQNLSVKLETTCLGKLVGQQLPWSLLSLFPNSRIIGMRYLHSLLLLLLLFFLDAG